jgi:hypothetical protein
MLVQDMLTGQLHEVPEYGMTPPPPPRRWPDPQLYGLGEVHDERGNSLGVFFLPKLIRGAASAVTGMARPAAQGALMPLLPPLSPSMAFMAQQAQRHQPPHWRASGGGLHDAPDLSEYSLGEVVYDGVGNPVALVPPGLAFHDGLGHPLGLPFLAPFVPAIVSAAKAVLPKVTRALPGLIARLAPKPVPVPAPAPVVPEPPPPAPAPVAPAPPPVAFGPGVPTPVYPAPPPVAFGPGIPTPGYPAPPPVAFGPGIPPPGYPRWAARYRRRRAHAR